MKLIYTEAYLPPVSDTLISLRAHLADAYPTAFDRAKAKYTTISEYGVIRFYKAGVLHREDGPAVVYPKSRQWLWYLNGMIHRDDGPAIKYHDGEFRWYHGGLLHREDGPAKANFKLNKYTWYRRGERYEASAHEIMAWKLKHTVK